MTEAGWTRNAPTKEGWYWWKRTENDNPVIVWVNAFHPDKQLRAEMISGRRELLTHFTGLFNGPITPDSYQQGRVAGLREAAEMVEDDCYIEGGELLPDYEHRCKHNVNQKELAGKIRFRANDLAQQAQEGGVGDGKAVGNETA